MTTPQQLLQAIQSFHADTSRTTAQTRQGLEEAASLIDLLIETTYGDEDNTVADSAAEEA